MNSEFSESSYAYALTSELIHWHGTPIQAAPVFPSTWEEGQPGMGYDVKLDRPGIPLLIQFKLSQCLLQRNAKEVVDKLLNVPYYRMHLMPAKRSLQHEMLLDHERAGNEVRYAAPMFYSQSDLDSNYRNHTLLAQSLWITPLSIGPLPSPEAHYVACEPGGTHILRSEPTLLKANSQYESFVDEVIAKLEGKIQDSRTIAASLQDTMAEHALRGIREGSSGHFHGRAWLKEQESKYDHPLKFCGALAMDMMGAGLFWVTYK